MIGVSVRHQAALQAVADGAAVPALSLGSEQHDPLASLAELLAVLDHYGCVPCTGDMRWISLQTGGLPSLTGLRWRAALVERPLSVDAHDCVFFFPVTDGVTRFRLYLVVPFGRLSSAQLAASCSIRAESVF